MRYPIPMFRLLATTCLLVATAGSPPLAAQQSRFALLRQADVVFVGTVLRAGAATFPGVPITPRTLVVRVDAVVEKPAVVRLIAGDSVTVEARTEGTPGAGRQATFYTTGWMYGEGIAVREVGHEPAAAALPAAAMAGRRDSILAVRRQVNDTTLAARIRAADMIVVGRVESIRGATVAAQPLPRRPVTEHDARWQEAILVVESAIKGAQAGERVVVRFPGSLDVAWHALPRFTVGQQGTFLLQRDSLSGSPRAMMAGRDVPAYTAVSKQDVLSTQDAARVQALSRP